MKAKVRYELSRTLNMGNYESTRVNIGVEIGPVSEDNMEATYVEAKEFVDKKVREEELKWRV